MAKGSGCCCGKCQSHLHCRGDADTCCKCVPSRICVSVYPPANSAYCNLVAPDDDPYGPAVVKTLHWDCSLNAYFGTLSVNNIDVPITFAFLKDNDGNCWFTLESDCLGHSFEFGYDNRIKVPLAGSFADAEERAERINACLNINAEFTVDFSACAGGCDGIRITVAAADYQPSPAAPDHGWNRDPYRCFCDCVCITLNTPDETFKAKTCFDSDSGTWTVEWPYIGVVTVQLVSEPGEPTVLRVFSPIGNGEEIYPVCSCREGMFAEWDFGSYGSVRINCDARLGCVDCRCFCRCVCITYQDDHVMRINKVCWDEERQEWKTKFTGRDYDETEVAITKVCDARTGITYLRLSSNLGDPDDLPANCPEVSGEWTLHKPDYSPVTINIDCSTCGRCLQLGQVSPCGCYDFIPETLFATFQPNALPPQPPAARDKSCVGAGGVVTLRFDTDLQCWIGSGTPFVGCDTRLWVKMTCADNSPGAGKMKLSVADSLGGVLGESGENKPPESNACEPFQVGFTAFHYRATDTCCQTVSEPLDIIDSNAYDIIITE